MLCSPVSFHLWPLFYRPCLHSTRCWLKSGPGPRPQPQTLVCGSFSQPSSLSTASRLKLASLSSCQKAHLSVVAQPFQGGSAPLFSVSAFPFLPYTPTFPCHRASAQTVISTGMVLCPLLTFTCPVGSFAPFSAWLGLPGSPSAA